MKKHNDLLVGGCIGLLAGFGIFLFFFSGSVNVNVFTCYYRVQTPFYEDPFSDGLSCFEGEGVNPCYNADKVENTSGLVAYSDVKPYLAKNQDKLLNISLNEVIK